MRANPARPGLSRQKGTARDLHGCEFGYTVYITRDLDANAEWREDRLYVSDTGERAGSLEELRRIMGLKKNPLNRDWVVQVHLSCMGENNHLDRISHHPTQREAVQRMHRWFGRIEGGQPAAQPGDWALISAPGETKNWMYLYTGRSKAGRPLLVARTGPEFEDEDYHLGDEFGTIPELKPNPSHYWGRAGAGILLTCEGRVLLVLRSQHVQEPGTWGIPGGSCAGEAIFLRSEGRDVSLDVARECAMHEFQEELGPLPDNMNFDEQDIIVYRDKGFTYTTFVWAIWPERRRRLDAGIKLNWENDMFGWFTVPQALALPNLHFGARYVLERLG